MAENDDFYTWNPQVHFQMIGGGLSTEEMASRTLSITYVDRLTNFDNIEWELDNRDGVLTHPEYIAGGLMVRLRMGYIDGGFPWKAFIINAMNGGVGVFGRSDCPIGENESKIRFMGRNRNAPGGSPSSGWSHRGHGRSLYPKPPKYTKKGKLRKGSKTYAATEDVTRFEMLLSDKSNPHLIRAATVSEGVREIARRNGFEGAYVQIQDTDDVLEDGLIAIPEGQTDGEVMAQLAADHGFLFKISDGVLYWHSPMWKGTAEPLAASYTYGDGHGLLRLSLLADFTLPMPTSVKAMGVNYRRRVMTIANETTELAHEQHNVGTGYMELVKDKMRVKALTGIEVFPVIVTGENVATAKAIARFAHRHRNTMGLRLDVVGNPNILAGKLVHIAGTNCPFVDRIWMAGEAKHTHDGSVYKTEVKLILPPAHLEKRITGIRKLMTVKDDPGQPVTGQQNVGYGYWQSAAPPTTGLRRR